MPATVRECLAREARHCCQQAFRKLITDLDYSREYDQDNDDKSPFRLLEINLRTCLQSYDAACNFLPTDLLEREI